MKDPNKDLFDWNESDDDDQRFLDEQDEDELDDDELDDDWDKDSDEDDEEDEDDDETEEPEENEDFPWLMGNKGDLTLDEVIDIETCLEDDDDFDDWDD